MTQCSDERARAEAYLSVFSARCSTDTAPEASCPTSDLERVAEGLWRFRYGADGRDYCAILDLEKFAQNTGRQSEKGLQLATCPMP